MVKVKLVLLDRDPALNSDAAQNTNMCSVRVVFHISEQDSHTTSKKYRAQWQAEARAK